MREIRTMIASPIVFVIVATIATIAATANESR